MAMRCGPCSRSRCSCGARAGERGLSNQHRLNESLTGNPVGAVAKDVANAVLSRLRIGDAIKQPVSTRVPGSSSDRRRHAARSSCGFTACVRTSRVRNPASASMASRPRSEKSWRCPGGATALHRVRSTRAEMPRPCGVVSYSAPPGRSRRPAFNVRPRCSGTCSTTSTTLTTSKLPSGSPSDLQLTPVHVESLGPPGFGRSRRHLSPDRRPAGPRCRSHQGARAAAHVEPAPIRAVSLESGDDLTQTPFHECGISRFPAW